MMSKSRSEVNQYFHGIVDLGSGSSADYVVSHAQRQRQRGRNPSVTYKGITNPRSALEAAQADIEVRDYALDDPFGYTSAFSGRIALIRVWSEHQKVLAQEYGNARMENNNATGLVIQELEKDEILQAPLHYRVTDEGTVELMIPF